MSRAAAIAGAAVFRRATLVGRAAGVSVRFGGFSLLAATMIAGCVHQVPQPAPAPAAAPASHDETAPAATASPGSTDSDASESPPMRTQQTAPVGAATPVDCVPPGTHAAAAKVRTKQKVVARRESPPTLPSAAEVARMPVNGVVAAEVRSMPFPVTSILGKQVKDPHGDDMGRVVDVLADASGRVRIAIIDFGGFLGVGDRRIAVDWPLLRFNPDGRDPSLLLAVGSDVLKAAPEYTGGLRPQTLMEAPVQASADDKK